MEVGEKAEVYQITQELDRKSVTSVKLVGGSVVVRPCFSAMVLGSCQNVWNYEYRKVCTKSGHSQNVLALYISIKILHTSINHSAIYHFSSRMYRNDDPPSLNLHNIKD